MRRNSMAILSPRRLGNCCYYEADGRSAFGGTSASASGDGANDVVDEFLWCRSFQGLFSHIEGKGTKLQRQATRRKNTKLLGRDSRLRSVSAEPRGSGSKHQASLHQHARRPARRSLFGDENVIGFLLVRNHGRPRCSAGDRGVVDGDQFDIQLLAVENNN
ncbi:unnamed protein product [Linum tenue]|uniref:Uncharacterized protein n=1 Tax=Linum tenue TaxID=586396 RepID=A0AAV0LER6_9ROSI|nr:unnamed protein product [Linum tenue]